MKGKITIEMDFDTGNPYVCLRYPKDSSDMRDQAMKKFREILRHSGGWCQCKFDDYQNELLLLEIHPINQQDLEYQKNEMIHQLSVIEDWRNRNTLPIS